MQALAKIGEELYLEPKPEGLALRTMNSSRSAVMSFKFDRHFFDYYEEKSEDDPCVTIGRWNELTYPCILKGGYVPEGVEPEEQVEIVVSGFVVGN